MLQTFSRRTASHRKTLGFDGLSGFSHTGGHWVPDDPWRPFARPGRKAYHGDRPNAHLLFATAGLAATPAWGICSPRASAGGGNQSPPSDTAVGNPENASRAADGGVFLQSIERAVFNPEGPGGFSLGIVERGVEPVIAPPIPSGRATADRPPGRRQRGRLSLPADAARYPLRPCKSHPRRHLWPYRRCVRCAWKSS